MNVRINVYIHPNILSIHIFNRTRKSTWQAGGYVLLTLPYCIQKI